MPTFNINYKFEPGDPVWFLCNNEVSKGVVDSIEFFYNTPGLSSRGYKVKEFFNRLLKVPTKDKTITGFVRYNVTRLDYKHEKFRSCPHLFKDYENKLFSSKQALLNSLT